MLFQFFRSAEILMRVTLNQIAEAAGVSRGTVDRALNNRGRINPEVAERILQIAKEMGYRRNLAGRALALSRTDLRIGVLVQAAGTPFIQSVLDGIKEARAQVREFGFEVIIKTIQNFDPDQALRDLRELSEDGCSGIALMPSEEPEFISMVNSLAERGIPVVTFNTDLEGSKRQCFVGQDSRQSGRVAAGLMAQILPPGSSVLVISGRPDFQSHRNRTAGFTDELSSIRPDLKFLPVRYAMDDEKNAEDIACQALLDREADTEIGIYLAAAGLEGVTLAVRNAKASGFVKLISNDLTDYNIRLIKNGEADFLIGQDPYTQGYEPVMILFRQLFENRPPRTDSLYTDITIKTKYNV